MNGLTINEATPEEDQQDKIDGWMVDKAGDKHSIQIKYRETGDDILFEVVKDLDKSYEGRDMVSKAEFYVIVNRTGYCRLFLTAPIKKWAQKLLAMAMQDLSVKRSKRNWKGIRPWEMKITIDRAHGNRKLMAYFSPTMFEAIGEWQLNL